MKKDLKKELKDLVSKIKTNSKDSAFAESLVKKLLSVKGQIDVEPTEIYVPCSDVIYRKSIENGAYEIIQTKEENIFATKGFRLIVKPYIVSGDKLAGSSLYEMMNCVFNLCREQDEQKDDFENADILDMLLWTIPKICSLPLTSFVDQTMTTELLDVYNKNLKRLLDKAESKIQEETPKEYLEFRQRIELAEELKKGSNV